MIDLCSNWFRSSLFGSIYETKATRLRTLLRKCRVVTPLEISPMTFWMGWSLVVLHLIGKSWWSTRVSLSRYWTFSWSKTWSWLFSWSLSFSSRFYFFDILAQWITSTSTSLGLVSSKLTWIGSSVIRVILLNIKKPFLKVEYPMSMLSLNFVSNFWGYPSHF